MTASAPRAQRRDAAHNRAQLIATAATAFRDEGLDVGVDEIARRAGVGVATLYRHFPAKTDLVVAVSLQLLDELAAARDDALGRGNPATALERYLRFAFRQLRENRGLSEALSRDAPDSAIRTALRGRMEAVLAPLVAHAHAHGELRAELGVDDVRVVTRMLGAVPDGGTPRGHERYLQLVLRGLRP